MLEVFGDGIVVCMYFAMQERAELAKSLDEERANNSTEKARLQQAATAAQQRADAMQAQVRPAPTP